MCGDIEYLSISDQSLPVSPLRTMPPGKMNGPNGIRVLISNFSWCSFIHLNEVYSRIFGHCSALGS